MVMIRSPFCGCSMTYSVALLGEDLLCYSVGLRKCLHEYQLTDKAYLSDIAVTNEHFSEFCPQDGGKNQLA